MAKNGFLGEVTFNDTQRKLNSVQEFVEKYLDYFWAFRRVYTIN